MIGRVVRRHLDKTQSLGMEATLSFITGYPQEELEDQNQTLDLIGARFGRNRTIGVYFRQDRAPLDVQLHLH